MGFQTAFGPIIILMGFLNQKGMKRMAKKMVNGRAITKMV